MGDLEKQPFYQFVRDTYVFHPVVLAALLYAMGGFPYIVWGMVSAAFLPLHNCFCGETFHFPLSTFWENNWNGEKDDFVDRTYTSMI